MHQRSFTLLLLVGVLVCPVSSSAGHWPEFRGPTRDGHAAPDAKPPTKWSETERVKWKTAIPGQGHSSPVVWGGQVWLTTAVNNGRSLHAVCADAASGKILHHLEVFAVADAGAKHKFNSYASPSPAIEEGRVYVSFGNHGVACIDTRSAKEIWQNRDLQVNYLTGAGSSPVLYKDLLILDCDGTDKQFIVALNKQTGKEAWRTPRSKPGNPVLPQKNRAFVTSVLVQIGSKDRLLSVGAGRAYCYDPQTGREIWNIDHGGYSNVSRPLLADGLMFFSSGYDKADLAAVKLPANESAPDAPPQHLGSADLAWRTGQGAPFKPSLLWVDGTLYASAENGVVRCWDGKTGQTIWSKRLGQAYSASPLYAGDHLYFFSEKGQIHVLKPGGSEAQIVSEIQMEEGFMASPAVDGNALILRTSGHLYRVE